MARIGFNVAGLTFREVNKDADNALRPEGAVEICPDTPENIARHKDEKALAVFWQNIHIGYVPADKTNEKKGLPLVQGKIHDLLKRGSDFSVTVDECRWRDGEEWNSTGVGVLGSVTLLLEGDDVTVESPLSPNTGGAGWVQIQSFNEADVVLDYHDAAHAYYRDGVRLKSVTGVLSQCYPEFNAAVIAQRCEKSYSLKAEQIQDLWKKNGQATADFGSAVHACLDIYQTYGRQAGDKAKPKHPVLLHAVESFPWGGSMGLPCHTEVLITSAARGLCGLADRIVQQDGKWWVSDIKLQVEATKTSSSHKNRLLPELPNTKVAKACIQCMIHAAMLEEAGMDVGDKVAAYVYAENGWETHVMDRIPDVLEKLREVMA